MRFYPKHHQFSGGIDLPARTMSVCTLDQPGELRGHRHLHASPEACPTAIAPAGEDRGVAAACVGSGDWRADRYAPPMGCWCPRPCLVHERYARGPRPPRRAREDRPWSSHVGLLGRRGTVV